MFENPGRKIKSIAKTLFYINSAITIIVTIIISAFVLENSDDSGYALLFSALSLIIGLLLSWLSSLFLYAFGEMVENSTVIRQKLSNNPDLLDNNNDDNKTKSNGKTETDNGNGIGVERKSVLMEKRIVLEEGEWMCPCCARVNNNSITVCKCGCKKSKI